MSCKRKIQQKSLPNLTPVLSNPKLNQTRRHSWFGTSLDPNEESNSEKTANIYDIKEETIIEEESESLVDTPWWKNNCNNNLKKTANSENLQPKVDGVGTKKDKLQSSGDSSINKEFVGLRRRTQNKKTLEKQNGIDRVSTKLEALPKRRSGMGLWLGSGEPERSSHNKDTNNKNGTPLKAENTSAMSPATQPFLNPLESRSMQRRATVHYSSAGRPAVMDFKRRTAHCSLRANEIRVLDQMKDVCRDYVVYRLRQRHLANRVTMDRQQSKERWLFQEIRFIESEMERLQKGRFSNISKQIGITLRSEDVLRKVFFELSTEIITTETKSHHENGIDETKKPRNSVGSRRRKIVSFPSRSVEITWGRICAILGIAGGLAVDCVQQGHADLVNYLVEYVGEFARLEGILSWISNEGGWESMKNLTYERSSRTPTADPCYFAKVTNIAIGFVVCTLGAVFGAVTIGNFIKEES